MFSVTSRITYIQQPKGGYINPKILNLIELHDAEKLFPTPSAYKSIQGMAVDYLTRFLLGAPIEDAFKISLLGAKVVDEEEHAFDLLHSIVGVDEGSIRCACQMVGYDVAYRRGASKYVPVAKINPDSKVIHNIAVMVKRSLAFFRQYGPVVKSGFTFEGGYNEIVSKGDGDFLTADCLWDFKVSKDTPKSIDTLQILVYYLLGIHSVHDEFLAIKKIGIFNPERNVAYQVDLNDVPDKVYHEVSRNVIGYCVAQDPIAWRTSSGTDPRVLNAVKAKFYYDFAFDTGFDPENYDDGIYDISIDDYWSYYRDLTDNGRPKFPYTNSVKFLKHDGFIMFISVTEKGTLSVLQGGTLRKLKRSVQYYYDRLPEYGKLVLQKFSKYWDALYHISKQVQAIALDKSTIRTYYTEYVKYRHDMGFEALDYDAWYYRNRDLFSFSGRVHGCIVDLDYYSHIYLNPYDGKIAPYYAPSMYQKYVYKNVPSLIAARRPEMLPSFESAVEAAEATESTALILAQSKERHDLTQLRKDEIDTYNALVQDTSMYAVSNRLKLLQAVYDYGLVVVWYDNVLPHNEIEAAYRQAPSSALGETVKMKNGMMATVTADYGYKDITVQFEDGTIREHCRRDKFRSGSIAHPTIATIKTVSSKSVAQPKLQSYVGRTEKMNCGLNATVIDDFGCNNITVQFEDGFIKKNCRRDKFREGKIGHK